MVVGPPIQVYPLTERLIATIITHALKEPILAVIQMPRLIFAQVWVMDIVQTGVALDGPAKCLSQVEESKLLSRELAHKEAS